MMRSVNRLTRCRRLISRVALVAGLSLAGRFAPASALAQDEPEIATDARLEGFDGNVKVEMTLTTPSCPSAQELPSQVEEAVRLVPGVTEVQVEVVWDPPWDQSRMSEDARLALNMF